MECRILSGLSKVGTSMQAGALFHKDESQDADDRKKMLLEEVQKILEQRRSHSGKRDKYFEESIHNVICISRMESYKQ